MQVTQQELNAIWEDQFFTPCETKDELKAWTSTFLKIDFPDQIIDEHSNSTPMDFVWEVYNTARLGLPVSHVAAAARAAMKTLSVSALEFLLMVHFRKKICHQAAIVDQSIACIDYLNKFINLPIMVKYIDSNTARKKTFKNLPPNKYTQKKDCVLKVIVASSEGANSSRANVLCVSGNSNILTANNSLVTARDIFRSVNNKELIEVLSVNPQTFSIEKNSISEAMENYEPDRVLIKYGDDTLECTVDHPIAIKQNGIKYIEASDLKVGDTVLKLNNKEIVEQKIDDITKFSNLEDPFVYDFTVENNHNFIANNLITSNCFDEVDLIDKSILAESAMIADPDEQGNPPIFIYISSRKSGVGPVQDKIDLSEDPKNRIRLHKWSLVDFLRSCPPETYMPDFPLVRYMHPDTLEIKDTEDLIRMPPSQQEVFNPINCFEGCRSCPAFIICQGRAPLQKQNVLVLRDQVFVASVSRETADADKIKAQLLNLKPESAGQVFNKYNKEVHFKPIADCYEFAFNERYEGKKHLTKVMFVDLLREHGWMITCGVDFGWQALSVAVLVGHHKGSEKTIVLHLDYAQGYPNQDWLIFIKENIYDVYGFDLLCPDCADMSAPKIAAKLGMPTRTRKPPKIDKGISWLRSQIWSPAKQKNSLMVLEDHNNKMMSKMFAEYQYKKTTTGFIFTQYEDDTVNSDLCFHPESMVITKTGAKTIQEVGLQDFVLTKEGTWRRVFEKIKRQYSGKMAKINFAGKEEIHCTDNHKFWVSLDKEISDYQSANRIAINKSRTIDVYSTLTVAPFGEFPIIYDLNTYTTTGLHDVTEEQIFYKVERKFIDRLFYVDAEFVFAIGRKIFEYKPISDSLMNKFSRSLILDKRSELTLPEFYDDLNREMLVALIAAVGLGCGKFDSFKCQFDLPNKSMAYQVYYCLVKLGFTPFFLEQKNKSEICSLFVPDKRKLMDEFFQHSFAEEAYSEINMTFLEQPCAYQEVKNGVLYSKLEKITFYNYSGLVFNLTVSDSHSYTSNGCAVSNCDATRYAIDPHVVTTGYAITATQAAPAQYYKGVELTTKENPLVPVLNKEYMSEEIKVHYQSEYGLDIEDPSKEMARIEREGKEKTYNKGFTFSF
jgi:intein/homing endonuclease